MFSFPWVTVSCIALLISVVVPSPFCVSNALWREIKDGCPSTELKRMCSSYLSGHKVASTTLIVTETSISWTYLTPHKTKTVTATSTVLENAKTITASFTKTLTTTQAETTVTSSACKPTITCGAATITNSFGPLIDACSCAYVTTITSTKHTEYTGYFPVVYNATTTSYYENYENYTTSVTAHPIVTTKEPTITAYQCHTVAAPPKSCNNEQMQYAFYYYGADQDRTKPLSLTKYKKKKPEFHSTGDPFGLSEYYYNPDYTDICHGRYLTSRGYIYTPQTGQYNWTLAAADNNAWLWVDELAYSGWNKSNSFLSTVDTYGGGGPWKVIRWEAGTYHAFRFAWMCYNSSRSFDFFYHLRRPDGHLLFGQYSPGLGPYGTIPYSEGYDLEQEDYGHYNGYYPHLYLAAHMVGSAGYQVQFGCGADMALAPRFPDWGHET